MPARSFRCQVVEKRWITPVVIYLRFTSAKKMNYYPGQFLSLCVPGGDARKPVRRPYTFAGAPDLAIKNGYELCIKYQKGGRGSEYVASLQPGDVFEATAPYGDFVYETKPERSVCFISTGTGIAPFRSMVLSRQFEENPPKQALCLYGARSEQDILFPKDFESMGVKTVYALSRADDAWTGFRGRVTDYLRSISSDWNWDSTDFYLCGNGEMIAEVKRILHVHNVPEKAIHKEAFFAATLASAIKTDPKKAA
ncbi:MAG: FAD-dependent oxidoreductase [Bdellovibrionota bacterium]